MRGRDVIAEELGAPLRPRRPSQDGAGHHDADVLLGSLVGLRKGHRSPEEVAGPLELLVVDQHAAPGEVDDLLHERREEHEILPLHLPRAPVVGGNVVHQHIPQELLFRLAGEHRRDQGAARGAGDGADLLVQAGIDETANHARVIHRNRPAATEAERRPAEAPLAFAEEAVGQPWRLLLHHLGNRLGHFGKQLLDDLMGSVRSEVALVLQVQVVPLENPAQEVLQLRMVVGQARFPQLLRRLLHQLRRGHDVRVCLPVALPPVRCQVPVQALELPDVRGPPQAVQDALLRRAVAEEEAGESPESEAALEGEEHGQRHGDGAHLIRGEHQLAEHQHEAHEQPQQPSAHAYGPHTGEQHEDAAHGDRHHAGEHATRRLRHLALARGLEEPIAHCGDGTQRGAGQVVVVEAAGAEVVLRQRQRRRGCWRPSGRPRPRAVFRGLDGPP
mmetsp:Transcript_12544/g.46378  ORF Transcript_12544/g.46378 Transcript_12544/m.46378 type:complete len:445 (-) Transcript_12544:219-1553(-)|eukprot:scaffold193_cov255-Pinguiococcus_pyrenoidosus.AAC.25